MKRILLLSLLVICLAGCCPGNTINPMDLSEIYVFGNAVKVEKAPFCMTRAYHFTFGSKELWFTVRDNRIERKQIEDKFKEIKVSMDGFIQGYDDAMNKGNEITWYEPPIPPKEIKDVISWKNGWASGVIIANVYGKLPPEKK